jgi:hypothetical protein
MKAAAGQNQVIGVVELPQSVHLLWKFLCSLGARIDYPTRS